LLLRNGSIQHHGTFGGIAVGDHEHIRSVVRRGAGGGPKSQRTKRGVAQTGGALRRVLHERADQRIGARAELPPGADLQFKRPKRELGTQLVDIQRLAPTGLQRIRQQIA
jgi:hypothetical protein